MKAAIGSSNTGASDHDIGDTVNNAPIGTGDGVSAPAVSINQASMNVHAQHTIVSYTPGRGPGVNITMSYNSNYSTYGISAFGSKWVFNYGSTLREENFNDNGQQDPVIITMPDGSTKKYHSSGLSGAPGASGYHYIGEKGDLNTVEKMNRFFTLVFPDGTRWEYQPTYSNAPVFLTKITDPWGLSLQFDYSVSGQLRIKNANNLVTTIYHSGQQNNLKINKIVDPFNRQAYFSYVGDNLTQVIDTGGRVFKYSYDNFYSDLIEIETPKINSADGNWLLHQEGPDSYQAVNYPAPGTDMGNNARIVTTNPLGDHEEFYYDESSGRSFHVTPQNYGPYPYNNDILRQTHYSFGLNFQGERVPIHIQYADNTFVDYRYEQQHGFVNQIIDRQRQVTNLTYNDKGQVTTVTDPKGNITTNTYAPNGFDVTGVAQPNPNLSGNSVQVMSATYDAYHQPLSVTDAGGTTRFSYYNWGALDTIIDPQGHASRNVYNGLGQKTASQYSDAPVNGVYNWNTVEQLTYDSKGRVAQVTDAANLTTGYTYNDFDQVTVTTFPDNTREEVLYLNGDVPVRVKDRAGRYSYAEYDALAQVKKSYVQDAQNNAQVGTTLTNYDKNGNLTALTDAKGNLTRWSYDALDRATGKQYHDGTTETYAYRYGNLPVTNETGLLAQTTGTRGQIIKYAYDANGNQTKIDYPNTPDVLMSYNALDDVAQVTDATGVRNFSYDNYGRLLSDDGPLISDRQTYAYDALQRIQTQTVQRGASGGVQSQSYAYDALGRLASINANGTQGTGLTTYAYDGNTDRLRVLTHPNGTTSDLRYDGLGRLTHVFNGVAGNPLYNRYASNYDTRDIKINTQSSFGSAPIQTNYYSYDALDQLKQERVTGGGANTPYTTNYSYDAMGNRTQVNRTSATATSTTSSTPNALNQLTSLTTSSSFAPTTISNLSYDAAGNLTQSIAPNGGNKTVYLYDDADRLSRIEKRDVAGALQTVSEFVYDYASRRAVTREYNFGSGGGGWANPVVKYRIFDGLDVVQERNAANEVTAQLVRDGNIEGILSRTTAQGAAFYGYDGQGNVTLLTNSAGQDVAHYRYDAFGQTLEAVGPRAAENPYRFSTKELHAASGLYDYGLRFYSPSMGRWINRDPIAEDGGVNLYAMVGNSPVNAVDEYGLIPNKTRLPAKYQKYQGTNFSRKEMDVLNRLHRLMKSGGVGFLVDYLNYGGKANLGGGPGRKTLAVTRTGRFLGIGTITTLDNVFFSGAPQTGKVNIFDKFQLDILIHEALHAYAGVKNTGGSPNNPPHARVYKWSKDIASGIVNGRPINVPINLDEVIRDDADPKYKDKKDKNGTDLRYKEKN